MRPSSALSGLTFHAPLHAHALRRGMLAAITGLAGLFTLAIPPADAAEVRVRDQQILVEGKPFVPNGAGGETRLEDLAGLGATVVRTYGQEPGKILDEAHKAGLKVIVGLWMAHPRLGFDYGDKAAAQAQLESFRPMVERYKDHPALLMWGIGNEIEVDLPPDPGHPLWPALEDASRFVKAIDPHHPTMAVTADTGADKVALVKRHAPSIDVLGLNAYGDSLLTIEERARKQGWDGPIIFTEMGANGHWAVPQTPWGAPLEPSSTEKAQKMRAYFTLAKEKGIGAVPILWGQKQEVTPTWYSLMLPTGEYTETVEVMAELWGGTPPGGPNRAPRILSLLHKGPQSFPSDSETRITLETADPDGDPLEVSWDIMAESTHRSVGGAPEPVPASFPQGVHEASDTGARIANLPPGHYRVFVTVRDGKGAAATGNLPIEVKPGQED
ncbi:glycoside hydrolase family 2 TIM barrel-domain containing protein [Xanthobacter sp. TB0136]|uniref:glycoside hydrolase family 2 TIM barrel-domain containing protein n=1 Tax=Xanthobacter sp. TB0136 TaxID=3459177 RepID=UPI0040393A12